MRPASDRSGPRLPRPTLPGPGGILVLALAGLALWQLVLLERGSVIEAPLPAPGSARPAELPQRGPLAADPALAARPVFSPSRRPFVGGLIAAEAAPVEAGTSPADAFDLVGLVQDRTGAAGEAAAVLLRPRGGGAVVRLRRGESIGGWQLVELGRRQLVFERDGVTASLLLAAPARPAEPQR